MFNFRPDLQSLGFRAEPPTEEDVPGLHAWRPKENVPGLHAWRPIEDVPGFRLANADSGQPYSYTPVRWTPTPSAPRLSFWDDVRDAAGQLGEKANAVVEGAYSILPGTGNFFRAAGRGLGFYGPEEAKRFRQEMRAAGQGIRFIANDPVQAARLAYEGGSAAFQAQPLLPYYLGGRAGMGALLAVNRLPFAPFAVAGDALRALENGHNLIDAGVHGVIGTPSGARPSGDR